MKDNKIRLDFNLNKKLADHFHKEVFRRKGMKKGNITIALEEAIKLWLINGEKQNVE